ncbi:HlyD family secretion protein [Mesoterricola sediminis]|uniref:HlyD family type I secretion periplasmic adaptor subunit n=1 Tax=Mesoterricola sediminis TaxID=2927980 RepID=A0AA48GTQ8_9BACT|nr:HlyD family efflux transporter periplasmic adaptor subunit [Mesoterricola sediminis]BDU77442.1 HlyD family type I secretion periplasmic adaptor subunit [Mesoterricola sediminis]
MPAPAGAPLFRQEALEAYLRDRNGREILRVSPLWSWTVTVTLACLLAAALAFAFLGKVDVIEKGPGILRPQGGVRLLSAQAEGVISQVLARTGDPVKAGDPILRLEAPQLKGAIQEADLTLAAHVREQAEVADNQASLFAQQRAMAQVRVEHLERETASFLRTRDRAADQLSAQRELHRQGLISRMEMLDHENRFDAAQRDVASGESELSRARQELAMLETQRRQQVWQQKTGVALAQARRVSLEHRLGQTLIASPVDGIVDGLVLRAGDLVSPGAVTAKVIPLGTPLRVIAFLREKDRAFVRETDPVTLELAQYPHAEFGTLKGQVVRVGTDLAGPAEIQEAFGVPEGPVASPSFRVEIQLDPGQGNQWNLRSGMLLEARFTLRRQRLAALVLDPLRRWLR